MVGKNGQNFKESNEILNNPVKSQNSEKKTNTTVAKKERKKDDNVMHFGRESYGIL